MSINIPQFKDVHLQWGLLDSGCRKYSTDGISRDLSTNKEYHAAYPLIHTLKHGMKEKYPKMK